MDTQQKAALEVVLGRRQAAEIIERAEREISRYQGGHPYRVQGGVSLLGSTRYEKEKPDWECAYCGSISPGTCYRCPSCGAGKRPREKLPKPRVTAQQYVTWDMPRPRPTRWQKIREWISLWWGLTLFIVLVLLGTAGFSYCGIVFNW